MAIQAIAKYFQGIKRLGGCRAHLKEELLRTPEFTRKFLTPLIEMTLEGPVSLIARRSGGVSLALSHAGQERLIGDKLGIAQAMIERNIAVIVFSEEVFEAAEDGIRNLVECLIYKKEALPVIEGVAYKEIQTLAPSTNPATRSPISLQEWKDRLQRAAPRDVDLILKIFDDRVLAAYPRDRHMEFVPSIMSCARRFNEKDGDIDAAIRIWIFLINRNVSEQQTDKTVRIMMDVANRLSNVGELIDIDTAIRIWVALIRENVSEYQFRRTIRTMMDVAKRLSSADNFIDIDSAIKIWIALIREKILEDEVDRVKKTMMEVANKLRRTDIDSAIKIWIALIREKISEDEVDRVKRTMMEAANIHAESGKEPNINSALKIWIQLLRENLSEENNLRISETVGLFASKYPQQIFKSMAYVGFNAEESKYFAVLYIRICYHVGRYDECLRFIDNSSFGEDPLIIGSRVEVLRKLKKYEEALAISGQMKASLKRGGNESQEILANLLVCRAYCFYEMSKVGEDHLTDALAEVDNANEIRRRVGGPLSPRALMLKAYIFEKKGDKSEAIQVACGILKIFPRNAKAIEFLKQYYTPEQLSIEDFAALADSGPA
ncbi:MAG: hypothetical protein ABIB65_04725 [Candidatus Margulisiibacteriota bacterium]